MIIIKSSRIILPIALALSLTTYIGCEKLIYPSGTSSSSNISEKAIGQLTLSGSTSMAKICNSLGESFMQKYPGITVEKSDTGSGAAVKSVLEGNSLLGDLSRELKDNEKNDSLVAVTIALDGIAVIVNSKNSINDISKQNLIDIFTGKITNWSEIRGNDAPIRLIGREASSGTREGFESVLGLSNSYIKYNAEYPETGDVVSKVGNDENAIGYCSLFSVTSSIKALKIDSIKIDKNTVSNGTYPIKRPFIQIYNSKADKKLISLWFDFIASDDGKFLIEREKLIPVEIEHIRE